MISLSEKIEDTIYMWFIFPVLWEAFMGVYYTMLPDFPGAILVIIFMWIIRISLWAAGAISVLKWIEKIADFINKIIR